MKRTLLPILCTLALAACSTAAPQGSTKIDVTAPPQDGFEITGKTGALAPEEFKYTPDDPRVSVYSTDGPLVNPLTADRTHSVLDNTTAGGYTVFDESVKVFPLPGNDVPEYLPSYAVPPLEGQYKKPAGTIGEPMGLASAGMLPPVPNVDVKTIPARKPMSLTAPDPLTMQPPAEARAPLPSPFDASGNIAADKPDAPRAPKMLTVVEGAPPPAAAPAPVPAASEPPAEVVKPGTAKGLTPGRRSTPLLTGY